MGTVGAHPSGISPYGLLDCSGTVFEWTAQPATCDDLENSESSRANLGGSICRPFEDCSIGYIEADPPATRMGDVGFRCSWSLVPLATAAAGCVTAGAEGASGVRLEQMTWEQMEEPSSFYRQLFAKENSDLPHCYL